MATKKTNLKNNPKTTKTLVASAKVTNNSAKIKKVTPVTAKRKTTPTSRKTSTTSHAVNVAPVNKTVNYSDLIKKQLPIRRSYIIAIIAAVVVLFLLYTYKGVFVAAVVNDQPISRLDVIKSLEQQGGKQALQSIVTTTLIKQEANKRGISVSQNDINNELKTIQGNLSKQGQTLDSALAAQGMTKQSLIDQITLQKEVEKMVGPVTVTNKDVSDYISKNKANIPPGTTDAAVKTQLQQQELQQKEQSFVEGLQNKAKISYWVNY
ncbi:MAG TPA: SurA N-terminal domain-containing protein [Patescibacteria group bacterium]|nr:SurA N-terminal domain-containing protein [Patescibacteria group bacterium]